MSCISKGAGGGRAHCEAILDQLAIRDLVFQVFYSLPPCNEPDSTYYSFIQDQNLARKTVRKGPVEIYLPRSTVQLARVCSGVSSDTIS